MENNEKENCIPSFEYIAGFTASVMA